MGLLCIESMTTERVYHGDERTARSLGVTSHLWTRMACRCDRCVPPSAIANPSFPSVAFEATRFCIRCYRPASGAHRRTPFRWGPRGMTMSGTQTWAASTCGQQKGKDGDHGIQHPIRIGTKWRIPWHIPCMGWYGATKCARNGRKGPPNRTKTMSRTCRSCRTPPPLPPSPCRNSSGSQHRCRPTPSGQDRNRRTRTIQRSLCRGPGVGNWVTPERRCRCSIPDPGLSCTGAAGAAGGGAAVGCRLGHVDLQDVDCAQTRIARTSLQQPKKTPKKTTTWIMRGKSSTTYTVDRAGRHNAEKFRAKRCRSHKQYIKSSPGLAYIPEPPERPSPS